MKRIQCVVLSIISTFVFSLAFFVRVNALVYGDVRISLAQQMFLSDWISDKDKYFVWIYNDPDYNTERLNNVYYSDDFSVTYNSADDYIISSSFQCLTVDGTSCNSVTMNIRNTWGYLVVASSDDRFYLDKSVNIVNPFNVRYDYKIVDYVVTGFSSESDSFDISGSLSGANFSGSLAGTESGFTTSLDFESYLNPTNAISCREYSSAPQLVCDIVDWPEWRDTFVNIPSHGISLSSTNFKIGSQSISLDIPTVTSSVSSVSVKYHYVFDFHFSNYVSGTLLFIVNNNLVTVPLVNVSDYQYDLGYLSSPPSVEFQWNSFSSLYLSEGMPVYSLSLNNLIEKGTAASMDVADRLDSITSGFDSVSSDFDSLENSFVNNMDSSLNDITVTDLSAIDGFVNSAQWVSNKFSYLVGDDLIGSNPLGLALTFSLLLGLAVLIIGRRL